MNNITLAALWMTGAITSFTTMAVAGRAISVELDTFEIMLFRSLIGIVIVTSIGVATGSLGKLRTQQMRQHVIRNLCHFSGQNLWFYALTVIPLAQVFALEFTSPVWVILLSPLFLQERITRVGLFCAALGFAGILIVARPDIGALNSGVVAAASSAIFFALTAIFTRKLTRTDSIFTILFYLTVMQAAFGLVCAGLDGDIALPSAQGLPWVVLISCAGLLAHFCLTKALSIAPATVVMPMDFVRLPAVAAVGMLVYNEQIDIYVFLGALVIFAANYINVTRGQAKPALSTD